MRIVAVADTHGFEESLGALPDGDVFVHAGDMLRAGTLDELEPVAAWIRALPHRHKIVVAGNHDWCFARAGEAGAARDLLGAEVIYLEDAACELGGVSFWGSPWQPEFCNWAFNLPRGPALAAKWARIPAGIDVLVTHGPPTGFGDRCWGRRAGCEDLREAVLGRVRPKLHLYGHIHEDGGFWRDDFSGVCLANVTTWDGERKATVLDIDARSKTVREVVVPPAENDR